VIGKQDELLAGERVVLIVSLGHRVRAAAPEGSSEPALGSWPPSVLDKSAVGGAVEPALPRRSRCTFRALCARMVAAWTAEAPPPTTTTSSPLQSWDSTSVAPW
jgi:hypothetical protein